MDPIRPMKTHLPFCHPGALLVKNAQIVTPYRVIRNGWIWIQDGRFSAVGNTMEDPHPDASNGDTLDVEGATVIPGLVDLHSDTLEIEIVPRAGASLPPRMALQELEQRFLSCGITSIFHAISMGYEVSESNRHSAISRSQMCYATSDFAKHHSLARTYLHLRYEISGAYALNDVHQALTDGIVNLFSIMDHRPGWGQMSRDRFVKSRIRHGLSPELAEAEYFKRHHQPTISPEEIERLIGHAHSNGIYVASHDDASPEQVRRMHQLGINIAEFPLTLDTASCGVDLGMSTIGGAANSLQGVSLSGNLCVNSALNARVLTALCSDYYPPALLHAPFKLAREGRLDLASAVRLVSLGPARAVGFGDNLGSIEPGKLADFVVINTNDEFPKVMQTWVGGRQVHQSAVRDTRPKSASSQPITTRNLSLQS